jgi:hypothetical protein
MCVYTFVFYDLGLTQPASRTENTEGNETQFLVSSGEEADEEASDFDP